jgi:hypothetical protein
VPQCTYSVLGYRDSILGAELPTSRWVVINAQGTRSSESVLCILQLVTCMHTNMGADMESQIPAPSGNAIDNTKSRGNKVRVRTSFTCVFVADP